MIQTILLQRFIRTLPAVLRVMVLGAGLMVVPILVPAQDEGEYPQPSIPTVADPKSVEDVMPYARKAVSNENAFLGNGLGIAKPGDKVILATMAFESTMAPEMDMYIEAIMRAYEERGVTPILIRDYEVVGLTRDQVVEYLDAIKTIAGAVNTQGWVNGCPPFSMNDFLKNTRPDLYDLCNPGDIRSQLPQHLQPVHDKMKSIDLFQANSPTGLMVKYLNDYMDENPDIKGVFYGRGGPIWENFKPKERWLGLFRYDNKLELMSSARSFPSDVWMLSEEITMEPLGSTDKASITDPEGTDVWWDLTEEQAQRWVAGVYLRGHLFMFPQEAYGSFGLNVLNYPATVPEYIPVNPVARLNGTLATTASHFGYYSRMEQIWEDGYLKEVRGDGIYSELARTLMKMPGIHDTYWPHYDVPGYFWHYETALGTNPKAVEPDPRYDYIAPGRERDGVMHWGFGAQVWHDPDSTSSPPPSAYKFEKEKKLWAQYHSFHTRTYFNTMMVRIRGTERWVTLVDRGRSTSLDNPEVRALASRYGNPDEVLATDWIPSIPGVNAPGNYETYAQDPYSYKVKQMEEAMSSGGNLYHPYVRPPRN